MAVDIILPKLGMDMQAGTIMKWYKNEGDTVVKGEPLFELMTDKVNIEVEAEVSGVLLKKYAEVGVELPVFTVIGSVGEAGEQVETPVKEVVSESGDQLTDQDRAALRALKGGGRSHFTGGRDSVRATPAARRLAAEHQLDLSNVTGSGPKGRIQVEDVQEALKGQGSATPVKDTTQAVSETESAFDESVCIDNVGMKDSLDVSLADLVAGNDELEAELGIDLGEKDSENLQNAEPVAPVAAVAAVEVSPLAAKIASVEGIDLKKVTGSGPDGKIVKEDVLKAVQEKEATKASEENPVNTEAASEMKASVAEKEAEKAEEVQTVSETVVKEEKTEVIEVTVQERSEETKTITSEEVELKEESVPAEQEAVVADAPAEEQAKVKDEPVKSKSKVTPAVSEAEVVAEEDEGVRTEAVTPKRRIIAERMVKSNLENAVITLTTEIDMTEVKELRKKIGKKVEKETGYRCTYTDFLLVSVSRALMAHPYINCSYSEDGITLHDYVNLGLAVGMDDGLVVPVINDTHNASFSEMVKKRSELLKMVKAKKLTADHFIGSTFTVTNLGMYGILEFSAIINQPNSAILSVGEVVERARVVKGEIVPRSVMRISLNLDHRVADGMAGAKFLQTVKESMENPTLLLF